eukprot:851338-Amphidinium_carterae.1
MFCLRPARPLQTPKSPNFKKSPKSVPQRLKRRVERRGSHAIVWARRNDAASPQSLAELLQEIVGLPGHAGVARSTSSLGARVQWAIVKNARALLQKDDTRYIGDNQGTHDKLAFVMEGVPPGATTREIATLCEGFKWNVLLQRRVLWDGKWMWHVAAAHDPENRCVLVDGKFVVIKAITDLELQNARSTQLKKRSKREHQNKPASNNCGGAPTSFKNKPNEPPRQ